MNPILPSHIYISDNISIESACFGKNKFQILKCGVLVNTTGKSEVHVFMQLSNSYRILADSLNVSLKILLFFSFLYKYFILF